MKGAPVNKRATLKMEAGEIELIIDEMEIDIVGGKGYISFSSSEVTRLTPLVEMIKFIERKPASRD